MCPAAARRRAQARPGCPGRGRRRLRAHRQQDPGGGTGSRIGQRPGRDHQLGRPARSQVRARRARATRSSADPRCEDGVVADMSARHGRRRPERQDRRGRGCEVERGAAATLPAGKTPPVLSTTSSSRSAAPSGRRCRRHDVAYGVQADNVLEMEVVTGDGELVTCSAHQHSGPFDAVRAGLGQVGVITAATLGLVAGASSVRRFQLFYPDLATMLEDARRLTKQGPVRRGPGRDPRPRRPAASSSGSTWRKLLRRRPAGRQCAARRTVRRPGEAQPRPPVLRLPQAARAARGGAARQRSVVLPAPVAHHFRRRRRKSSQVVATELGLLNPPADLGHFGQVVLSPIRRAGISTPLLRMPTGFCTLTMDLATLLRQARSSRADFRARRELA